MKKTALLLLSLSVVLFGCSSLQKPFYYQIESPEGGKGYVLGTIHLGVPWDEMPSEVKNQLLHSNPVFVEVDLTSSSGLSAQESILAGLLVEDLEKSPSVQEAKLVFQMEERLPEVAESADDEYKQALRHLYKAYLAIAAMANEAKRTGGPVVVLPATFAGGKKLKDNLSPTQWNQVVDHLKLFFGPESVIETLHIETVYAFLSQAIRTRVMVTRAKAQRLDSRWSMDINLMQWAKSKNKEIRSLDSSLSFPASCMADFYLMRIEDLLAKSGEALLGEFDRMEEVYRSGNLEELNRLTANTNPFGRSRQCLLVDRNLAWIPQIDEQLKQSKRSSEYPFFAFGAGHLSGSSGVLQLLKDKGYKVQQVEF